MRKIVFLSLVKNTDVEEAQPKNKLKKINDFLKVICVDNSKPESQFNQIIYHIF